MNVFDLLGQNFGDLNLSGTRVFPAKEIDARGQQVAKMQTKDAN